MYWIITILNKFNHFWSTSICNWGSSLFYTSTGPPWLKKAWRTNDWYAIAFAIILVLKHSLSALSLLAWALTSLRVQVLWIKAFFRATLATTKWLIRPFMKFWRAGKFNEALARTFFSVIDQIIVVFGTCITGLLILNYRKN